MIDLRALEQDLLEHPDLRDLAPHEQLEILKERAKHIVGGERLLKYLERVHKAGRGLRAKVGFDATGRDLHLGHMVQLVTIRKLQKMGHEVTLVVGDFTALIGDPAGRIAERLVLTEQQVEKNLTTYEAQAGRIIDLKRVAIRRNSEWLAKLPLREFFKMIRGLTVASAMQREDFRKRASVTRLELLYASLTGIDSIELKTELEFGGDDQLLNFYDAARVMEINGLEPEAALTSEIIVGTSGQGLKMSKSLNNYIALEAKPEEMFGQIMSIPDLLLEQYFKLLTDIREAQWRTLARSLKSGELKPLHLKRTLARIIVADLNTVDQANKAEEFFNKSIVQKKPDIKKIRSIAISLKKVKNWVGLVLVLKVPGASSGSTVRRLFTQKGIHLHVGDTWKTISINDPLPRSGETLLLRIGKRQYTQVKIAN
ncbi:MAG: tyrosine--tRNA ligase [Parcubacteria group bacterium]